MYFLLYGVAQYFLNEPEAIDMWITHGIIARGPSIMGVSTREQAWKYLETAPLSFLQRGLMGKLFFGLEMRVHDFFARLLRLWLIDLMCAYVYSGPFPFRFRSVSSSKNNSGKSSQAKDMKGGTDTLELNICAATHSDFDEQAASTNKNNAGVRSVQMHLVSGEAEGSGFGCANPPIDEHEGKSSVKGGSDTEPQVDQYDNNSSFVKLHLMILVFRSFVMVLVHAIVADALGKDDTSSGWLIVILTPWNLFLLTLYGIPLFLKRKEFFGPDSLPSLWSSCLCCSSCSRRRSGTRTVSSGENHQHHISRWFIFSSVPIGLLYAQILCAMDPATGIESPIIMVPHTLLFFAVVIWNLRTDRGEAILESRVVGMTESFTAGYFRDLKGTLVEGSHQAQDSNEIMPGGSMNIMPGQDEAIFFNKEDHVEVFVPNGNIASESGARTKGNLFSQDNPPPKNHGTRNRDSTEISDQERHVLGPGLLWNLPLLVWFAVFLMDAERTGALFTQFLGLEKGTSSYVACLYAWVAVFQFLIVKMTYCADLTRNSPSWAVSMSFPLQFGMATVAAFQIFQTGPRRLDFYVSVLFVSFFSIYRDIFLRYHVHNFFGMAHTEYSRKTTFLNAIQNGHAESLGCLLAIFLCLAEWFLIQKTDLIVNEESAARCSAFALLGREPDSITVASRFSAVLLLNLDPSSTTEGLGTGAGLTNQNSCTVESIRARFAVFLIDRSDPISSTRELNSTVPPPLRGSELVEHFFALFLFFALVELNRKFCDRKARKLFLARMIFEGSAADFVDEARGSMNFMELMEDEVLRMEKPVVEDDIDLSTEDIDVVGKKASAHNGTNVSIANNDKTSAGAKRSSAFLTQARAKTSAVLMFSSKLIPRTSNTGTTRTKTNEGTSVGDSALNDKPAIVPFSRVIPDKSEKLFTRLRQDSSGGKAFQFTNADASLNLLSKKLHRAGISKKLHEHRRTQTGILSHLSSDADIGNIKRDVDYLPGCVIASSKEEPQDLPMHAQKTTGSTAAPALTTAVETIPTRTGVEDKSDVPTSSTQIIATSSPKNSTPTSPRSPYNANDRHAPQIHRIAAMASQTQNAAAASSALTSNWRGDQSRVLSPAHSTKAKNRAAASTALTSFTRGEQSRILSPAQSTKHEAVASCSSALTSWRGNQSSILCATHSTRKMNGPQRDASGITVASSTTMWNILMSNDPLDVLASKSVAKRRDFFGTNKGSGESFSVAKSFSVASTQEHRTTTGTVDTERRRDLESADVTHITTQSTSHNEDYAGGDDQQHAEHSVSNSGRQDHPLESQSSTLGRPEGEDVDDAQENDLQELSGHILNCVVLNHFERLPGWFLVAMIGMSSRCLFLFAPTRMDTGNPILGGNFDIWSAMFRSV